MTGWHRHSITGTVHQAPACFVDDATPVLVLPLDGLEETIAREVGLHFIQWRMLYGDGPIGEWFCSCGAKFGFSVTAIAHLAHHVARALAGDGAR